MIAIEDNFFKEEDYIKILNAFNNIKIFTPKLLKNNKTSITDTYGIFNNININDDVGKLILEYVLKKFKYKYNFFSPSSGFYVRKQNKTHEHTDIGSKNLLIYLDGQEKFFNGTIWINNNVEDRYSIQIGYIKNRAVHFDSNIPHTPMSIPSNEDYGLRKFIIIFGRGDYI